MNTRRLVIIVGSAALAAALSALPAGYLHAVWPQVPAQVATHYGRVPDQFTSRAVLWDAVWYPVIVWVVLTFWPQVHAGQSMFWSSPLQRRIRLLLVSAVAACLMAVIYKNVLLGREAGVKASPPPEAGRASR